MIRNPEHAGAAARRLGGFARPRVRMAAVLAPLLATVVLPGQDFDPVQRMLLADAERLVKDADPELRGEAALLLGSSGEPRHYEALVQVARDSDPEAALRGIVALGLLGAPGCEHWLERWLDESATRPRAEGIAAALALGLLPESHEAPAVDRYLARFLRSSYRRQRDVLAALLLGLATSSHPSRVPGLRMLLDDAANRDPELRALLITVLGRNPGALDAALVRRLLDEGSREERGATLRALLAAEAPPDPALLDRVVRLQQRDPAADVRAAALAWLTRARHLPALESAAAVIKSSEPAEVDQGVRTALLLGGSGMRRALEPHIQAETRPAVKAALLRAFDPPFSAEHAASCLRLSADRREGLALRAAAALAVARSGDANAAPALRDLFRETDDPAVLRDVARALVALGPEPPELDRLSPDGRLSELARSPARVTALLLAGHASCARFVLETLSAEGTSSRVKAGLLRAVRLSRCPVVSPDLAAGLPSALAAMFR